MSNEPIRWRDWRVAFLLSLVSAIVIVVLYALSRPPLPKVIPENTVENALVPTLWPEVIDDLPKDSLLAAIEGSLSYLRRQPSSEVQAYGDRKVSVVAAIAKFEGLLPLIQAQGVSDTVRQYLRQHFEPMRMNASSVLMTGYYVPQLLGARERSAKFAVPLHSRPKDMITVKLPDFIPPLPTGTLGMLRGRIERNRFLPYFSREHISFDGVLDGQGLEVAWLESQIDAFFLQVQGSGEILLPDGSRMIVGYDEQNGHPYRAVGKLLIDQGFVPKERMSKAAIVRFLQQNPGKVREVLSYNPSYVFMKELSSAPVGHTGIEVTAGRTIATDRYLYPPAALALVQSTLPVRGPDGEVSGQLPFSRLVLNQDTGGAIRGPSRLDLFIGKGSEAGWTAGYLKNQAEVIFLAPR